MHSGRIGAPRHILCRRLGTASTGWNQGSWLLDPKQGGGAVRDLAIHDYDVVNWIGGLPQGVCAAGEVNHFTALFTLSGSAFAQVEASFQMPAGFPFTMSVQVQGEAGLVTFDGRSGTVTLIADGKEEVVPVAGSRVFVQDTSEEIDAYYHEIAYFVECVRLNTPPLRAMPEDARDALAIAERVEQALTG